MTYSIRKTLTEGVCANAHKHKNRDPKKDFWVRDKSIRGLALKVTPADTKIFTLDYVITETNSTRRHRIGKYGDPWCVKEARTEAMRLKLDIAKGEYPFLARSANTMRELLEFYINEKKYTDKSVPARFINRYIVPSIGGLALEHVTSQTVEREADEAAKKGGLSARNNYIAYVSAAWNKARAKMEGMVLPNPAAGLKKNPTKRGARAVSPEQYDAYFNALKKIEKNHNFNPFLLWALEMLAYTGYRKEEIANIKLSDIHWDRNLIIIPEHKTSKVDDIEKCIHITDQVRKIITKARKARMEMGVNKRQSPYLFIAFFRYPTKPLPNTLYRSMGGKIWKKVVEYGEGQLDGFSNKSFRSGLASIGRSLGLSDEQTAGVTQHANPATVTRHYARNMTEDVKANTALIANAIDSYRIQGDG